MLVVLLIFYLKVFFEILYKKLKKKIVFHFQNELREGSNEEEEEEDDDDQYDANDEARDLEEDQVRFDNVINLCALLKQSSLFSFIILPKRALETSWHFKI